MTYTYGDGICCHYFRDVVRESFDVVGDSTSPTVDYQDELTIGVAITASGFEKVTEFGYWLSQFVGLVSSEEHQLVIHDSVAGCIYTNCNQQGAQKRRRRFWYEAVFV